MADIVGIGAATEAPGPFRLSFQLTGDPIAKQRPRVTRNGTFTPRKTRVYEDALAHAGKVAMQWRGPVHTSLVVRVQVALAIPKSWSAKKRQDASDGVIRPGKPDVDNYLKTAMDALNGIVWRDDAQIVTATVEKWYGTQPHMRVEVEEWGGLNT